MERLRYIARADDVGQQMLVEEAAIALSSLADDHNQLVMACRQMISHHPASGAIVSLAARLLTASNPRQEAWDVVDDVRSDLSTEHLIDAIASPTNVVVAGWSDHLECAMAQRPDIYLVDSVEEADIALVDAQAADPSRLLVASTSRTVLLNAKTHEVALWAVAAFGSILPTALFDATSERAGRASAVLKLGDFARVIHPDGQMRVTDKPLRSSCPFAAELT